MTIERPGDVAAVLAALPAPRLLVFDCDGVLAPIVSHADDALLLPGAGDALTALAAVGETTVAILSGRSLAGLEQFSFDESIEVVGSYGAERRGRDASDLGPERLELLERLTDLATGAAEVAGEGAWVEHKPASVVLHVREADPDAGALATRRVRDDAERLHGVFVHDGKSVVELAVHRSDKGTAIAGLLAEIQPASVVYLGDDEPDEAAFAEIAAHPIPAVGVRVGPSIPTAATHRLADPDAVVALVRALVRALTV